MAKAKSNSNRKYPKLASVQVTLPEAIHPEAFAMMIKGKCLSPKADDGQVALIEPVMPKKGEIAFIKIKGHDMPVIKILDSVPVCFPVHPESTVIPLFEFRQINPPLGYRIAADHIEKLYRVHSIVNPD